MPRSPAPKLRQLDAHSPTARALEAYRQKRSFDRTPEPGPDPAPATGVADGRATEGAFVVQKHDARRLHYDLRLELDGILKSWAVTRGPSLIPGEKRLAVQTEDHPLKYLDFEGVIPAGEYGGGTMIVWDTGRWTPHGDPRKGLAKGHLEFALKGQRLHGRWHLVKMRRRPKETKDQWLLIKSDDDHARTPDEPDLLEEQNTSLLSGLTNDELASRGEIHADHARRIAHAPSKTHAPAKTPAPAKTKPRARATPTTAARGGKVRPRKALLPVFVEPMLATLVSRPPTGADWIHEIKFDGYRIQARLDGGEVVLLTRKGVDWTHRFPTIAESLSTLPAGSALLDGEVIVETGNGVPDFAALQADLSAGRHDRMLYYAFDLLYRDGADVRATPLVDRKAQLAGLLDGHAGGPLRLSDHVDDDGEAMLRHACRLGLEGVVSKKRDAPYASGRGHAWTKAKCVLRQEFVVVGFTLSTATRGAIAALLLGTHEDGRLTLVGRVGTGFSTSTAQRLREDLAAMVTKDCPVDPAPRGAAAKGLSWVEPLLVAEVEFRGWTADSLLRQASFKGLREDKPADEVVRERVEDAMEYKAMEKPAGAGRRAKATAPDLSGIRLTHPERILWAEQGISKQGLAEFYAGIADWVLPHVTHRPLSLVRCPSGAEKQCFFQKHRWDGLSPDIHPVEVGDSEPMTYIEDLRGLIGLVQAGVLEIHPWGSRVGDIERPDRLIFDLDPGDGVGWTDVISGARDLRDRLATMGLASFVKTSGGKGLHVVLPIAPGPDWDTAKAFTKELVESMAAEHPDRYVATMSKAKRAGRIFIDYLRNGRGATAVAAFSTRARAGAPVSTPLGWDELSDAIRADHYTVTNLQQRLDHLRRDPWEGFFTLKQSLPGQATPAKAPGRSRKAAASRETPPRTRPSRRRS